MRIRAGLRAGLVAGAAALAATSLACSFSHSSGSLSDSSESSQSSSESSRSSSPESNASKYRQDVSSYTQAYVVSGGAEGTFLNGVSDLAQKRGISNWEADDNTWRGIGRGLGKTKVDQVQLAVYEQNWAGNDPHKVGLIRKGFGEVR
jgi:hypothetical protein